MVKLRRLAGPESASVYVKLEGANPTGSMKDRMALSMIRGAESRGELAAGGRVIEYTGGSTGSSLAMVCAQRGYRAYFVSSDGFSAEKLQTMRAFGATVEIVPAEGGILTAGVIDRMIARTRDFVGEPGTFWPDQVNRDSRRQHFRSERVGRTGASTRSRTGQDRRHRDRRFRPALPVRRSLFVDACGTGPCAQGRGCLSRMVRQGISRKAEPASDWG